EHVVVPMTCVSEGAIDVYVEPFVRPRRLIVAGATPVAAALSRLARAMDYDVVRVVEPREQPDVESETGSSGTSVTAVDAMATVIGDGMARGLEQAAVIASQGHYDEDALERCLRGGVQYVGLVASHRRGATVARLLREAGVPGVDRIHYPAG